MTGVALHLIGRPPAEYVERIAATFPDTRVVGESDLGGPPRTGATRAAGLIWALDIPHLERLLQAEPDLPWLHLRWSGVPPRLTELLASRPTVLTNGTGAHGTAVAEYVLAVMLAHYKRLREMAVAQERSEWLRQLRLRELRGQTVGLLGLGDLGRAMARLLRPFGVRLLGLRRGDQPCEEVDEVIRPSMLDAFLRQLDALVVAIPLTPETRDLIGAREIALLRKGAFLVNVGRGPVVVTDALVAALHSGHLSGAAVDVFDEEPLPAGSPLWHAPHLILSPHCSDNTDYTEERELELFLDNFGRFREGRPLRNVFDPARGY